MAKATITMKSGATAVLEGTADEVAAMTERLGAGAGKGLVGGSDKRVPTIAAAKTKKVSPMTLLTDLIEEGFFAEPRTLGAIANALRQMGRFYPTTTLSPTVLRLVRKKQLRRIKDKQHWTYVL